MVLGETEPLAEDCLVPTPALSQLRRFTLFSSTSASPLASRLPPRVVPPISCSHQGGELVILPACFFFPLALLEQAPGIKQDYSPSHVAIFATQTHSVS